MARTSRQRRERSEARKIIAAHMIMNGHRPWDGSGIIRCYQCGHAGGLVFAKAGVLTGISLPPECGVFGLNQLIDYKPNTEG